MKDVFDTFMKKQLLEMCGSEDDYQLELRKLPLMNVDSPNYESITPEKLKAMPGDKLPKLQSYGYFNNPLVKIELSFTNGLDSAAYATTTFSTQPKCEQTWDISKKVKIISVKTGNNGKIYGMQFLDENDNELNKWDCNNSGTWKPVKIPDGFEIIGIYGDTRKDYTNPQFGFLIYNPPS